MFEVCWGNNSTSACSSALPDLSNFPCDNEFSWSVGQLSTAIEWNNFTCILQTAQQAKHVEEHVTIVSQLPGSFSFHCPVHGFHKPCSKCCVCPQFAMSAASEEAQISRGQHLNCGHDAA
jgi:hypothetical protein